MTWVAWAVDSDFAARETEDRIGGGDPGGVLDVVVSGDEVVVEFPAQVVGGDGQTVVLAGDFDDWELSCVVAMVTESFDERDSEDGVGLVELGQCSVKESVCGADKYCVGGEVPHRVSRVVGAFEWWHNGVLLEQDAFGGSEGCVKMGVGVFDICYTVVAFRNEESVIVDRYDAVGASVGEGGWEKERVGVSAFGIVPDEASVVHSQKQVAVSVGVDGCDASGESVTFDDSLLVADRVVVSGASGHKACRNDGDTQL